MDSNAQKPKEEIIIFSNLSKEEKIKYFNFFLDNDIVFEKEGKGTYLAEIQLLDTSPKVEEIKASSSAKQRTRSPKRELNEAYSVIYETISPQEGLKGSKMKLNQLRFIIEEVYSLKFLEDTKAMANNADEESPSFSEFFANYLSNKFKKKQLLDQMTINILSSIEFYSRSFNDIKIFSKFLRDEYDADDLIFFLFVRSCIEKELKTLFTDNSKQALTNNLDDYNDNNDLLVPIKSSGRIALLIFGKNESALLKNFVKKLTMLYEKKSINGEKELVKASAILAFALEDYHNKDNDQQEEEEDQESNMQVSSFDEGNNINGVMNTEESRTKNLNTECANGEEDKKREITNQNIEDAKIAPPKVDIYKNILKKNNIEKCKMEADRVVCLKNVASALISEREIHTYFKRIISSSNLFSKNEAKINKNISKVKSFAIQRFNLMINFIVGNDKKKFLTVLGLKENNTQGNKYYNTLYSLKEQMLKTHPFSSLDEALISKFIKAITDIPEIVSQISKLILKLLN